MSNMNISSNSFMEELKRIISTIVWKNKELANYYEANTNPFDVDMFMAAHRGMITFANIPSFPLEVLQQLGMSEEGLINLCVKNKENIPIEIRDSAVSLYIKYITKSYKEKNDYYRMLYGLPTINENTYFYVVNKENVDNMSSYNHILRYNDYYVYLIRKNIVNLTPLHELDEITLFKYDSIGLLNKILEKYPSCKYVNHLTKYKIDLYTARATDRYDILYIDQSNPDIIVENFKEVYNLCKNYMIRVFYTDAYRSNNTYYEGFIGMCILFMSIQQMYYKYLEADLTREFYDLDSLRVIYDSYGVPFFEEIPLKYHQRIVRNINKLITYKGSSQVLIDLFNIFDFKKVILNQFYLVKKHILDDNGDPVFNVIGYDNGNPIYDYKSMFELSFSELEIGEDPHIGIMDSTKKIDYNNITEEDEYWVNDQDLLQKLYESEFNFIESKYIGISLVFDLHKITFECCYFMKMIQDNKNITSSKIKVYHDYLEEEIYLFDLVIYSICLICKSRGWDEVKIIYQPEQIAKLYGYEFKKDLWMIKNDIEKINDNYPLNRYGYNFNLDANIISNEVNSNPLLDNEICNIIKDMNIDSKSDVDKVYSNINSLIDFLNYKIETSSDRQIYEAYKEFRETILTSTCMKNTYLKTDGNVAQSFNELLSDSNTKLYDRLNSENVNLSEEIDYCLFLLKKLASDLEEFDSAFDMDKLVIIKYLMKILSFFKSAKIDMTQFNIIYTLGSRSTDLIKFFMENKKINSIIQMKEIIDLIFNDYTHKIISKTNEEGIIQLTDLYYLYNKIVQCEDNMIKDDIINFKSKLAMLKESYSLEDYFLIIKLFIKFYFQFLQLNDDYFLYESIDNKFDNFCMKDLLIKESEYCINILKIDFNIIDFINEIKSLIKIKSKFVFLDSIKKIDEKRFE